MSYAARPIVCFFVIAIAGAAVIGHYRIALGVLLIVVGYDFCQRWYGDAEDLKPTPRINEDDYDD